MTFQEKPFEQASGFLSCLGGQILLVVFRIASIPLILIALCLMSLVYAVGFGSYLIFHLVNDSTFKLPRTRQPSADNV